MKGSAHSAVTVINAIATGMGGAVGIDLKVTAEVEIIDEGLKGEIDIRGERYTDYELIRCVKEVLEERYGRDIGLEFIIESEIPVGKGLKSSSAVSNALTKAAVEALDLEMDDRDIIDIGIQASKRAEVTLTGALDDAYASYFGGMCLTDNLHGEVLLERRVEKEPVIILIPERTVFTRSLKNVDFESIQPYIDLIFSSSLDGEWRDASFLNGIVYSDFLGYETRPMFEVLEHSDVVGLSGTGPAIYSITGEPEKVKEIWSPLGEIIEVSTR
ncbi:MAG: shikimate kinase [Thermoplasmata archaeon]